MEPLADQLVRLAERGPVADPRFVVRRAIQDTARTEGPELWTATDDRGPSGIVVRQGAAPRPSRRWLPAVAATVLLAGGVTGVALLSWRDQPPAGGTVPSAPATLPTGPAVDPQPRTVLSADVPADVQPPITIELPGWRLESFSGFQPMPEGQPSVDCAGCATWRLVVADDGPLFDGGLFTAWTVAGATDALTELDTPVTIGQLPPGRSTSSPADTPPAQRWTTLAWPLGDGPGALTAVVDARGLPYEQVVELAGSLTFESWIPAISDLPAGFRVVDRPEPTSAEHAYLSFTDGHHVLNLYATNRGLQGLLDWRYAFVGDLLAGDWQPREIEGTTVAFAWSEVDGLAWGDATWVAGGWGYAAHGVRLDADAFAATLASLELTDADSFASETNAATTALLDFPVHDGPTWATSWRERRFGQ